MRRKINYDFFDVTLLLQVSTCLTRMLSGRLALPMMTSWRGMAPVMLSRVSVLVGTSLTRMTQLGRLCCAAVVELRYRAASLRT